jgi:hypothetical protein
LPHAAFAKPANELKTLRKDLPHPQSPSGPEPIRFVDWIVGQPGRLHEVGADAFIGQQE